MIKIQVSCENIHEQNYVLRLLKPLTSTGKVKHNTDGKYLKLWILSKDKKQEL